MKKHLRRLLLGCLLALALAGLAAVLLLTSPVQTLVAQMALERQAGLRATLGSLAAGLGQAELTDFHLKSDGVELSLPSLEASLPVPAAVWARKFAVRRLVAKGWTLDLSRCALPGGSGGGEEKAANAEALPGRWATLLFGGILGRWTLPADTSLDEVELDGRVLLPGGADYPPVAVHVVVKGANVAVGREGSFDVQADADLVESAVPANSAALRGHLVVAFDSAGVLERFGLRADLSAEVRAANGFPPVTVELAAATAAEGGTCSLALLREARTVAGLRARYLAVDRRFEGEWSLDTQAADLALFLRRSIPVVRAASGAGTFAAAADLGSFRAAGGLKVAATHLGLWVPQLERVGAVTLDAGFDLAGDGATLQIQQLRVAVAGDRPAATVRWLQPFRVDVRTGDLHPADPRADWLECSLQGLPPDWLAGWFPGYALEGGGLTGGFVLRDNDGKFSVRATVPLAAAGVTIRRDGRILGQKLDWSLGWKAEEAASGWRLQLAPLTLGCGGRQLATGEASVAQPAGRDGPVSVTGKWSADLEAVRATAVMPGIQLQGGRVATGEVSLQLDSAAAFTGSLSVVGRDPAHTLTANLQGRINSGGAGNFFGPVRIALGPDVSEITVDGYLTGAAGAPVYLGLTGEHVAVEHLGLLASQLSALSSLLRSGDGSAAAGAEMTTPFWGDWTGRVKFTFPHLVLGGSTLDHAGGVLEIAHDKVELQEGRGDLAPHQTVQLEGSIAFDPAAATYRLNAAGKTDKLEAAALFAPSEPGGEPVIEGRFALAATIAGAGNDWADLLAHTREEYRLTSTVGIVRFLKTNLAGVNPEKAAPVSDAVIATATSVGRFMGASRDRIDPGTRRVPKRARAVLDFTYRLAELGYSQASVTAIRGPDRTLRLTEIALTTPNLHLTGTGRLGSAPGVPLAAQALDLDLQLCIRESLAALVAETDLVSAQKDGEGFFPLRQPVHFSGTPGRLDCSQWHDRLLAAARQPPPETKAE